MQLEIETERLNLRPLSKDDLALALDLFTDERVMRYVGEVETPELIRRELPIWCQRAGGGAIGIWATYEKETGVAVGSAILLPMPVELDDTDWSLMGTDDMPDAEIEVGYLLKPDMWGKGYATELCERLLDFGFENTDLEEIVAVTDLENDASRRVLTKSGMREHGKRRAYATETTDFRMTRAQWTARQ